MNSDKPLIELLPPLDRRCRAVVALLRILFSAVPLMLGVWMGVEYDWIYGFLVWISAVFVGLILLSKLKTAYVPHSQHELSHSATAILKWFAASRLCTPDRDQDASAPPGDQ